VIAYPMFRIADGTGKSYAHRQTTMPLTMINQMTTALVRLRR